MKTCRFENASISSPASPSHDMRVLTKSRYLCKIRTQWAVVRDAVN